ncbi:MAG: response regulator [Chloroflexi bacterium]|nr:response regulator [Chloroflexota bacterium]
MVTQLTATRARILIADDDPYIRELLGDILSLNGYEIEPAGDGKDALARINSAAPALVILDLAMPRLDGYGVLEQVRAREETRDVPVIVLTAHGSKADAAVAIEKGADDFIAKPFDVDELLVRIEAVLRRKADLPHEETPPRLQIWMCGPLRVCMGAGRCIDESFARRKAKALFAYLYLHRGRLVSKDELMENIWPECEGFSPGRIKQLVLTLRDTLEPGRACGEGSRYILEKGGYYCFNAKVEYSSDVEEFERHIALAKEHQAHGDIRLALEEYHAAIELRSGEFLSDFRYEDWAACEAARLKEAYLETLEDAATLHAAMDDHSEAVRLLKMAVGEDKLRESTYLELMRYLWRDGKRTEALLVYESLKQELGTRLGVEPEAEVTKLYEAIKQDR